MILLPTSHTPTPPPRPHPLLTRLGTYHKCTRRSEERVHLWRLHKCTTLFRSACAFVARLRLSSSFGNFYGGDEGGGGGCCCPLQSMIPFIPPLTNVPMIWYVPPLQIAPPLQFSSLARRFPFMVVSIYPLITRPKMRTYSPTSSLSLFFYIFLLKFLHHLTT